MRSSNKRYRFISLILYGLLFSLLVSLTACRVEPPTGDPLDPATPSPARTAQSAPTQQSAARTQGSAAPTQPVSTTPAPTMAPASTVEVDASALQGVAIQFWHTWPGEAGGVLGELVGEFNAANEWGVQVQETYVGNYDAVFRKVIAAIGEGSAPDLVTAFPYQALAWEEAPGGGGILDLNEYVNDPAWGLSAEEQADFYPAFWEGDVVGGKRLGVPAQRSGQVLYYNRTWAQELGFDAPPATLDEFEAQACAAAEANRLDDDPGNDLTGGWIVTTDYPAMLGWMYAFESEITPPTGSGYRFNTPQVEETFNFLRGLYDQGCAWLPESDPPEEEFAGRDGLFMAGSVAGIPHQSLVFERLGSADEFAVLPFPSPQGEPAISVYGPSFVILESQPGRQLAAWLFLKWLALPENQARLAQAAGTFPTRRSAQEHLAAYAESSPQWAAAQELLPYAHAEPAFGSWSTVRWAVGDAATQLFRYYFTIDGVPSLVELLDETAEELNGREFAP